MRSDVYIKEVLSRCDALKRAGMWLSEPIMRPVAWIGNFDECDKQVAAQLLERFVFYNQRLTDALLKASFNSISDGLKKGPKAPNRENLLKQLPNAVFTLVSGENPNPTDSGYFFCRRARQILNINDNVQIKSRFDALEEASKGRAIVFVDDFIGSGDQFLSTWKSSESGISFEQIRKKVDFTAVYISLVGTEFGINNIWRSAPEVALCVTHRIDDRGTLWGLQSSNISLFTKFDNLLKKYVSRLQPNQNDSYMKGDYLLYGYKKRGLFFAFEHSVPDATLPIFWCRGTGNWEPLIERT